MSDEGFNPSAITGTAKAPPPESKPKKKAKSRKQAEIASSGGDNLARGQLRALVERIERLEEEKATIGEDIKEVYAEAKGAGFDTKVLRRVVKIRKQDQNERMEEEAVLDLYLHALGMIPEPSE
jgi:uncharacterized protein (UPF0335 family)